MTWLLLSDAKREEEIMSKERVKVGYETSGSAGTLKKAIIIFAIVEALVLVPTIIYVMLR